MAQYKVGKTKKENPINYFKYFENIAFIFYNSKLFVIMRIYPNNCA